MSKENNLLEKHAQTVIHVKPRYVEDADGLGLVTCENRTQTRITVAPNEDDTRLYSLLEYIPFKDIQKKNIRVFNIERKHHLHFSESFHLDVENCLFDDDGVNELCIELKTRAHMKMCKKSLTCVDQGTQTYQDETQTDQDETQTQEDDDSL